MRGFTGLSFLALFLMLFLLPLLFGELMVASLAKLHLSPDTALLLVIGILFGGIVNIPIKRIVATDDVPAHPLAVYGLSKAWPRLAKTSRETIVAVNVGGCVIPTVLAAYELSYVSAVGPGLLLPTAIACAINTYLCYAVARPMPGVGIVMPGLLSPLAAALLAVMLAPSQVAPVAFIAGVIGPLVGADLFHLKDIQKAATGIVSIGGAGTFDGIVLSGIVAAYLA